MYDDSRRPPSSSNKLILILLAAIIMVIVATFLLNGGNPAPEVEVVDNDTNASSENQTAIDYKLIGNNSYGTVTKSSGYGNPSSDIHVALILGVDAKQKSQNAIVPTLQSLNDLNYSYDVYVVDAVSGNSNDTTNTQNNLTVNEMSESLAAEYVVPDVVSNNYNFTIDVHYTNDSNSYLFVPSENTYTSQKVLERIVNTTNVGRYTPDTHGYTEYISESIIGYEIPSIVYVTKDYYSNGTSAEISSIIKAIDSFDFFSLFNEDTSSTNDSYISNDTANSSSSNDTSYENVVTVTSNSSGNKEIN